PRERDARRPAYEGGGGQGPGERGPYQPPAGVGQLGGSWFRIKVGRQDDADPKWLIPVICRLGQVTKPDIGEIRIFERETKFEIAPGAAARFTGAIQSAHDERDRIEPAHAPGPREKAVRPKIHGQHKPGGGPPGSGKRPFKAKGPKRKGNDGR
ncbi:MAG TPA: DbpA RNA binding domain-containing protein, partial [Caulobacteraceae bacterium]